MRTIIPKCGISVPFGCSLSCYIDLKYSKMIIYKNFNLSIKYKYPQREPDRKRDLNQILRTLLYFPIIT